jgi:hypothetical protein
MSIQVIGAGLAGLAAACALTETGEHVVLFEAAKAAGGRARSYFDPQLNCRIDNGNHLLLSGNAATMAFLKRTGMQGSLTGPTRPVFPFVDLQTGEHWKLRLNSGRLPWWIFLPSMRVPGTKPADYFSLLKMRRAGAGDLVKDLIGDIGPLYRNLLEPLAISALNTLPDIAIARGAGGDHRARRRLHHPALSKNRPVRKLHRSGLGLAQSPRRRYPPWQPGHRH